MKNLLLILPIVALFATAFPALAVDPITYAMISPTVAAALKGQAETPEGKAIIGSAKANLTTTPNPFQFHVEGTLPHQGTWDQSVIALRDFPITLKLALAYRMTGDRAYLEAVDRYLSAWMGLYNVTLNPIDETGMDQLILAYDLTSSELSAETKAKMEVFLRGLATGYLGEIDKQKANKKVDIDNWQSHRIKLLTMASFSLGEAGLIERAQTAYMEHLAVNIDSTGLVHDFLKRDALHYVVYDLEPLTMAALSAKAHGQDWFHAQAPNGASVPLGLAWLTPFALGEKTHEEFVHSKIGFDAARAKAGMKGFAGLWEPVSSLTLFQTASVADAKYLPVYDKLLALQDAKHKPSVWLTLLAKAGL